MSQSRPLQGGCSCGRNRYTIQIPQDASETAQVFFDNTSANRRSQASPLSAWLRVPLSWYQSTTYAFFPDEPHSSIRRTYTSPLEQNTRRQFCGFCGTPLSYWSESPASEADHISLTLGSLVDSDLQNLEELGLLPRDTHSDAGDDNNTKSESTVPYSDSNILARRVEGLPWFEALVEGSTLGKMTKSRDQRQSGNGRYSVEWEVVEWTDNGEVETGTSEKRKLEL